ncbi:MAG: hypothetical protein HKP61_11235 [Dactylosporangium sp.]|nr:hypothetical protein [Dactylosporangium sp.]NNJ61499.1 hypothetical protein [Dactylosporangium sp.]
MICTYIYPVGDVFSASATALSVVLWAPPGFFALGIVAGVRHKRRYTQNHGAVTALGCAMLGALITGISYGGIHVLIYGVVIPLPDRSDWIPLLAIAAATAPVVGIGCGFWAGGHNDGDPDDDLDSPPPRLAWRYGVGIAVAAVGCWTAGPVLAGAIMVSDSSKFRINSDHVERAGQRNLIVVTSSVPANTRCHVSAPQPAPSVRQLPFRPYQMDEEYLNSFIWVAEFTATTDGPYTATCAGFSADIRSRPQVQGWAAAALAWPLPAIRLFGAVPGLLILADTAGRAVARRLREPGAPESPGPTVIIPRGDRGRA